MKPVRTVPRFRCEFCTRVATKAAIARHETRCFRNPDRWCDACGNTGTILIRCDTCGGCSAGDETAECPHCKKFKEWAEAVANDDAHADYIATGGY